MKKLLLCLFFLLYCTPVFAFDGSKPFVHYAENQALTDALYTFARQHNLNVTFTQGVQGKLSGRFENISSKDFLESMRVAFGIAWYEQGGILNFYNQNEMERAFISTKVIAATQLVEMLKASFVISPDLPVQVMPNSDIIVVNGPPGYINQIRSAIAAFEEAQASNFIMQVFPLKYAWAEDITVNSMDSQVTIPGVATILKAMVSGSNLSGSTVTQIPSSVPGLLGQGLAGQGGTQAVATPQPASATGNGGNSGNGGNTINIIADPRVNSVIITDAEYRMPYYQKVIADLDKPVELVEIHAAIVDIDSSFNRELGINFQGGTTVGDYTNVGGSSGQKGTTSTTPTPGIFDTSGLSMSTLYSFGADFFLAKVQALENDDNARVLGKPSVLTMDNVQATLENTSTYYIKVEGKDAVDLFKVESGTILKVTPHIIEDNNGNFSIKLVVNVQDDQGDNSSEAAIGALPPIKQTKINTQAIVREGQSLLIGGYYYEQASDGDSGVPGLKNIPVLGNLFKTTNKKTKQMERLILITPRIVRLGDEYNVPARVDEPSFSRSPTQSDYSERTPVSQPRSGCSKSPSPTQPATPVTALQP